MRPLSSLQDLEEVKTLAATDQLCLQKPAALAWAAFCPGCPPVDEVTDVLQALGFRLAFQMGEVRFPVSSRTPPLPAQYHYCDRHNTEVIYLAGPDADTDGACLPLHASRFWVYCGVSSAVYEQVLRVIAVQWPLIWNATQDFEGVA